MMILGMGHVGSDVYFKRFYIGDFYIIGIVILVAVLSILIFSSGSHGDAKAIISLDGEVVHEIELDKVTDRIYFEPLSGFNDTIVAQDGKIRFESSDCPDQVCVRTGWISKPGQVSVCLPAGIIIRIVGKSEDEDIDILLK